MADGGGGVGARHVLALIFSLSTGLATAGGVPIGPPLDLNQATRAEIEAARGVGVELTERLLQARAQGPFKDWIDLRRRVKGIGRKALQGMAEAHFHLNGQPAPAQN